jgi:hypothetical protein
MVPIHKQMCLVCTDCHLARAWHDKCRQSFLCCRNPLPESTEVASRGEVPESVPDNSLRTYVVLQLRRVPD